LAAANSVAAVSVALANAVALSFSNSLHIFAGEANVSCNQARQTVHK
jgi:hypothetical protein